MHVFEIFYKLLISNVDKSNRTMSNTSETNEHALTLTPSQMLKRYAETADQYMLVLDPILSTCNES